MVIIILGVLSVGAAPKFLNIQKDARVATLKGLKGAIESATKIVYGKAIIQGVEGKLDANVKIGNDNIHVKFGYPWGYEQITNISGEGLVIQGIGLAGRNNSVIDGLQGLGYANDDNGQWKILKAESGGGSRFTLVGVDSSNFRCTLSYQLSNTKGTPPTIDIDESC